ncbi:MAG TPA: ATP synthase subunit I [Acidimicrobiales bacterium]|nr:ATP synthase subunit I [Acidimicrobiales bacterium]
MSTATADVFTGRDLGPAPEREVVADLLRRAVYVGPVFIALGAIGWGTAGALSAAFAITLVVANFALAAALMGWAARISFGMLAGVALFGYLIRIGLVFAAVWLVKDASWVERVPLGLTLVITHLGLLFWEVRYVSASLAFPGLTPVTKESTRR